MKSLFQDIGSTSEREAYILMDRVNPPTQVGFILRPDAVSVEKLPLISELGVFGIYVRCVCLCVVSVGWWGSTIIHLT